LTLVTIVKVDGRRIINVIGVAFHFIGYKKVGLCLRRARAKHIIVPLKATAGYI
jgi:hypothetical protein